MQRLIPVIALIALVSGCVNRLTNPDGTEPRATSPLGFHISGTQEYLEAGGAVTARHGELADRWWGVLMRDLTAAGYEQADPKNIRGYAKVILHQPHGPDSLIYCGVVEVGGFYRLESDSLNVPGDYDDPDGWLGARQASQPLLHEMTHRWCYQVLGHACLSENEEGKKTVHAWKMPNGQELWNVQWQNVPPAASIQLLYGGDGISAQVHAESLR